MSHLLTLDQKLRRYDVFERHKSVGLVRQYLTCIDELTSICGILQRKIDTLNKLMELVELDGPDEDLVNLEPADLVDLEPADPRDQPETASSRIKWATDIVQDQHRCCQSLLEDLRLAAEAVRPSKRLGSFSLASSSSSFGPSSRMNLPSSLIVRTRPFSSSPSSQSSSSRFHSSQDTSA